MKLTQHWSNVVKLPCSGHNTCRYNLNSLQFRQQAVTDPVQKAVAVVKVAADERVYQCLCNLQSQR